MAELEISPISIEAPSERCVHLWDEKITRAANMAIRKDEKLLN